MTDNSNNEQERILTTRNLTEALKIIKQKGIEQGIFTEEQFKNPELPKKK